MARAPLRTRRRRRVAALLAIALIGAPAAGYAAMAVVDAGAIAKLSDQLSRMQQQIDQLKQHTQWLTKLSGQVQDQIDAIGAVGQISMPSVNLDRLTNRVMGDVQCLKPDFSKLMPGMKLDEMRFSSICAGRSMYKDTLWFDPDKIGSEGGAWGGQSNQQRWESQAAARNQVEARREALVKEVVSTGLAQADLAATDTAETNQRATEELAASAKAAETTQARLATIAQGQVLTNRQLVQQNQLLAQILKVQSAMLMQMTLPAAERPPELGGKPEGKK